MSMTEADVIRELAWQELESEPPEAPGMTNEQFDEEVMVTSEGGWADVGLDELPEQFTWEPTTIEDLVHAE